MRSTVALVLLISMSLATGADARHWRWRHHHGAYDRSARFNDEGQRVRGAERGEPRRASIESTALAAVIDRLIRGCSQQASDVKAWPFDDIDRVVVPDDSQRQALEALRVTAVDAADRLASQCPQSVSPGLSARLEAVEESIDATLAAFATVQPPLQGFYAALDDEQKARLYRDLSASGARARADERLTERAAEQPERRSHRWRRYASVNREYPSAERNGEDRNSAGQRNPAADGWSAVCEDLTAALRAWPMRDIESNVRLSDQQRVVFYELVTSSLKAANTLASDCPAETALTPLGRMETMRKRLAAVRAAMTAIRPAMVRFYDALDQEQKVRFVGK